MEPRRDKILLSRNIVERNSEYEAKEAKQQFEDVMFWQKFMVEKIFEEEDVVDMIKLCFSTNSRKIK